MSLEQRPNNRLFDPNKSPTAQATMALPPKPDHQSLQSKTALIRTIVLAAASGIGLIGVLIGSDQNSRALSPDQSELNRQPRKPLVNTDFTPQPSYNDITYTPTPEFTPNPVVEAPTPPQTP